MAEGILKAIPVLHDLEEEELKKFLAVTHRLQVPKGAAVIREGEAGGAMYILVDGAVEISKSLVMKIGREDFQDRDKTLTKLSAEDHAVFGEVALFEQGRRTATVGQPQLEALQMMSVPVQGFQTTNATKLEIVAALQLAFEQERIKIINDPQITAELMAYQAERLPSGLLRYGAPEGMHDDIVMSLCLAYWAMTGGTTWLIS